MILGTYFLIATSYEDEGKKEIDRALSKGWKVAGIAPAVNSGGVWVMLVADRTPSRSMF